MDKYSIPSSSLVWNSWSPWSRTGAFYFPRYPESWRGSSMSFKPRAVYATLLPKVQIKILQISTYSHGGTNTFLCFMS